MREVAMRIILIIFKALIFIQINSFADWEKALKNPPQTQEPKKSDSRIRSEGINVKFDEEISTPKSDSWATKLAGKSNGNHQLSPEIADLLDKISQMDRMLPDDSIAKHVLFSQFAVAYLHAGDFLQA
jgi:hypothetical protein